MYSKVYVWCSYAQNLLYDACFICLFLVQMHLLKITVLCHTPFFKLCNFVRFILSLSCVCLSKCECIYVNSWNYYLLSVQIHKLLMSLCFSESRFCSCTYDHGSIKSHLLFEVSPNYNQTLLSSFNYLICVVTSQPNPLYNFVLCVATSLRCPC